ncbi:MAG: hypothetical protein K0Q74_562 [Gammaproteobacteria bacterium]|jgi:hypothetical protein|nr:hypothetical protein [Gammaproteobacteria bacterium]
MQQNAEGVLNSILQHKQPYDAVAIRKFAAAYIEEAKAQCQEALNLLNREKLAHADDPDYFKDAQGRHLPQEVSEAVWKIFTPYLIGKGYFDYVNSVDRLIQDVQGRLKQLDLETMIEKINEQYFKEFFRQMSVVRAEDKFSEWLDTFGLQNQLEPSKNLIQYLIKEVGLDVLLGWFTGKQFQEMLNDASKAGTKIVWSQLEVGDLFDNSPLQGEGPDEQKSLKSDQQNELEGGASAHREISAISYDPSSNLLGPRASRSRSVSLDSEEAAQAQSNIQRPPVVNSPT